MTQKILMVRLSSLGDVILTTGFLSPKPINSEMHVLTSLEYVELFRGHPDVDKVWVFDRKKGSFLEWKNLAYSLWLENYTIVFDLHSNLRTALLWIYFRLWWIKGFFSKPLTGWVKVSKKRERLWGYFIFKKLWPKRFRPSSWSKRFTELRLKLDHSNTLKASEHIQNYFQKRLKTLPLLASQLDHLEQELKTWGPFLAIMPSSAWPGKNWPVSYFVEFCEAIQKSVPKKILVLGQKKDPASLELLELLQAKNLSPISGIDRWSFTELIYVLSKAQGFLGTDSGLSHLTQALGIPTTILYGPTRSDQGFGPWAPQSQAIESSLWCRPCGKDGRYCFRRGMNRYLCLKQITPQTVLNKISLNENKIHAK